jgi:hypothetical protein
MKKIFLFTLIINILYCNDDINQTSLDMFLFKIGFKSLVGEFNDEKKIIHENRILINALNEKVQIISDGDSKNILSAKQNLNANELVLKLEKKILALENKINILEKKNIVKVKNILPKVGKYISARVVVWQSPVYNKEDSKAKILFNVKRDDIVKIELCNNYGWCKLFAQEAYIAKYKLRF